MIKKFDELFQPGKLQTSRFKARGNNNKRIRLESATIPQDDAIAILKLRSPLPFKTRSLAVSYRDLKADQSSLIIQDIAGNDLPSLRNFPVEIISNANNNIPEFSSTQQTKKQSSKKSAAKTLLSSMKPNRLELLDPLHTMCHESPSDGLQNSRFQ